MGPGTTQVYLYEVLFAYTDPVKRDRSPQVIYDPIWRDANLDGDADDWQTNPAMGWWNSADVRAPICYTVSEPVKVATVKFFVFPAFSIPLPSATAKGQILGSWDAFQSVALQYDETGLVLTATIDGASYGSTWTTIARVADYPIDWRVEVSGPGGVTPYPAGTSRNHVHWVLLDPPTLFSVHYTMLDIGCRRAHGMTGASHQAIADTIFDEFELLTVFRATDVLEGYSQQTLKYYDDWLIYWTEAEMLLLWQHGQCAAWVDLFIRCLHTVGIDPPNEKISVSYDEIPANIFGAQGTLYVKNWDFTDPGENRHAGTKDEYPYLNIWDFPHYPYEGGVYEYNWLYADAADVSGVQGQGPVSNPLSDFNQHIIATVGSMYYDVSYGQSYTSASAFESAAFAGYALDFTTSAAPFMVIEESVGVDLNDDGDVTSDAVAVQGVVLKKNPIGLDLLAPTSDSVRDWE